MNLELWPPCSTLHTLDTLDTHTHIQNARGRMLRSRDCAAARYRNMLEDRSRRSALPVRCHIELLVQVGEEGVVLVGLVPPCNELVEGDAAVRRRVDLGECRAQLRLVLEGEAEALGRVANLDLVEVAAAVRVELAEECLEVRKRCRAQLGTRLVRERSAKL
jgi:hypothetical protein